MAKTWHKVITNSRSMEPEIIMSELVYIKQRLITDWSTLIYPLVNVHTNHRTTHGKMGNAWENKRTLAKMVIYPLVNVYITMERSTTHNEKTHYK